MTNSKDAIAMASNFSFFGYMTTSFMDCPGFFYNAPQMTELDARSTTGPKLWTTRIFSPPLSRKPRRPFINNTKRVFKCYANLTKQTIVKQATENRNAVRHTSWWIELRQRIRRIRSPITSCFGHDNETGTQRK